MSLAQNDLYSRECLKVLEDICYAEFTKMEILPKAKPSLFNRLFPKPPAEPYPQDFFYLYDGVEHYMLETGCGEDGTVEIYGIKSFERSKMMLLDGENGDFSLVDVSPETPAEATGFFQYVCPLEDVRSSYNISREKQKTVSNGFTVYYFEPFFAFDAFDYPRSVVVGARGVEKIYEQKIENRKEAATFLYDYQRVNSLDTPYKIKKSDVEKASRFNFRFPVSKYIEYVD